MDPSYQKKDKLSSHISCKNKTIEETIAVTTTEATVAEVTTTPKTTDSTTTQPSSPPKKKGKRDHWGGTAWGDGNLSKLKKKKKREWRNTSQKIVYPAQPPTEKQREKQKEKP